MTGPNSYDSKSLNLLLSYVHEMRGIDFGQYRTATVHRKLELRMREAGLRHGRDYVEFLKSHPDELDLLIKTLTIKVSSFFRNPLVFEIMSETVLPDLIAEYGRLKVWSLGCAHGEEPYSVAMIAHSLQKPEKPFDVKILGTDICDGAIESSFAGIYPADELAEVKKKYLDAYFEKVPSVDSHPPAEGFYRVSNEIKSMVRLECGDILGRLKLKRSKKDRYNLILCRNVLIYMNKFLQSEVVQTIAEILEDHGYFVIGASETIPTGSRTNFTQPFPGIKIFRKASGAHAQVPSGDDAPKAHVSF